MQRPLRLVLIVLSVLTSCCANVFLLELITIEVPGAGNIITFAQFSFIALEGFLFSSKFCTKRRHVPLKDYLYLVITFFLVNVSNNYAMRLNISMPLNMIFKSGSLIANMVLGVLILRNRYTSSKYIAVALITMGIFLCTIASAGGLQTSSDNWQLLSWLLGILMLTFSLLASARMGIYQETLSKVYGKHARESMFYCHALPIPAFLLLSHDIVANATALSASEAIVLIPGLLVLPKLWLFLLLNAVTQYVCARSVFTLTTETTSLVVTLVLTLRKFISLLISIYYFSNPFTLCHWIGAVLVLVGTFVFCDLIDIQPLIRRVRVKQKAQRQD